MANIRTIALSGAEIKVEIAGQNCAVRNDGTDTVYASRTAGVAAGADGVLAVPAGQSAVLRDTCGALFLLGTGSVQLVGADYDSVPFKTVSASGGSGADEVARAAISAHAGNAEIHVTEEEKSAWNAKAELSDIPTSLPANGGNADTVGGKTANDFMQFLGHQSDTTIVGDAYYRADYHCDIPDGTLVGLPIADWHHIIYYKHSNDSGYGVQIAYPFNTDYHGVWIRCSLGGTWKDWVNIADGSNAATLETHPASDFVLKSEYDALAARVAALEGGT